MRDEGASAVLGGILMLSMTMMLVPGLVMLKQAISDEMAAHREAAERAAFCARHPDLGPPACEARGPLPGFRCDELAGDTWLCRPTDLVPTPEGARNATRDAASPLMQDDALLPLP